MVSVRFDSPRRAVDDVRIRMGVVVSCITPIHLIARPDGRFVFAGTGFALLRGEVSLRLSINQVVATVRDRDGWYTLTQSYAYDVQRGRDTDASLPKVVIQFHYHPLPDTPELPEGWVSYPHVHVETALVPLTRKAHIPSGAVSLAATVRFLVTQLGVAPLRADWETALRENERDTAM